MIPKVQVEKGKLSKTNLQSFEEIFNISQL